MVMNECRDIPALENMLFLAIRLLWHLNCID